METIKHINKEKKKITLCAWCDGTKEVRNKWIKKGYSVSDWICDKCDI